MIQKNVYAAPEVSLAELDPQTAIVTSPAYGKSGQAGDSLYLDDDDYDYGLF